MDNFLGEGDFIFFRFSGDFKGELLMDIFLLIGEGDFDFFRFSGDIEGELLTDLFLFVSTLSGDDRL